MGIKGAFFALKRTNKKKIIIFLQKINVLHNISVGICAKRQNSWFLKKVVDFLIKGVYNNIVAGS